MVAATAIALHARTVLTTACLVNKILKKLLCSGRSAWKSVLLVLVTKEVFACLANRLVRPVPGIQMSARAVITLWIGPLVLAINAWSTVQLEHYVMIRQNSVSGVIQDVKSAMKLIKASVLSVKTLSIYLRGLAWINAQLALLLNLTRRSVSL